MKEPCTTLTYSIRVRGSIPAAWVDAFSDLEILNGMDECGAFTQLDGNFADLAALHGVLNNLYNLGLALIYITRIGECAVER